MADDASEARRIPEGVCGLRARDGRGSGSVEYGGLLKDPRIIRNRLKIRAVAENARRVLAIRESHGSFGKWLDAHHPRSQKEWERLFKETFVFTGGKIVQAFLMSTGYMKGAHVPGCPVYAKVPKKGPAWARKRGAGTTAPAPSVRSERLRPPPRKH